METSLNSNFKPFYKRTKFKVVTGAVILFLAVNLILYATWPHWLRASYRVTVTDKQRATTGTSSMYLVFTKDAQGKVRVFKNVDSKFELKWNSSDLQGELEIGKTYDVKVYGVRFGMTSSYQNIVKVSRVSVTEPLVPGI